MSVGVTVRLSLPDDLRRLAELERSGFAEPWPEKVLEAEIRLPAALVLSAVDDEETVRGYACFRVGVGEAELLRVAVDPAFRRQGVASALLLDGLERLRRQGGIGSCFLEVRTGNEPAIAAYRALGFTPVGLRRAYYRDGSDALVFALALAS
jgi:[ribosomal protein S18]-alanine N-acetyltransferase